ncbi:hypothetical protein F5Y17DRAFT_477390 [Xylariaceae sp. FL0594]|nr:hypothetical protein F5Y17DRAFT_477390 [Xylariaceae sp. FL0594]
MEQEVAVVRIPREAGTLTSAERGCLSTLSEAQSIKFSSSSVVDDDDKLISDNDTNLVGFLRLAESCISQHPRLGETCLAVRSAVQSCLLPLDFGGLELDTSAPLSAETEAQVLFVLSTYVEAAKSAARSLSLPKPLAERPDGRRPMTMAEKIFAAHDISRKGWVRANEVIQVDVDWILASELAWGSMNKLYESIGRPGIFRNDRFWLAGDHRVEPAIYDLPDVQRLMDVNRRAHQEFKMTEFQGFNYTIMHTEFVRERALPGQLVIGADSHSCSAGSVSCLAIGMGVTDVVMPLVTGQTWFAVPETVSIRFEGRPPKGIGGKDTILYVLKEFRRNTVAADRIVEFSGPGLRHLSGDARFAIANMCTEFGAVTGIFEADERTVDFISRRARRKYREGGVYYRPDPDAEYAAQFTIDLSRVTSFVALCPSPDNVVPVTELSDYKLDGCFIGACTTAEEDLIIGALILKAGLEKGFEPVSNGRRLVVPGSRPILRKLEDLGLLDFYRRAGFDVGAPGCSMCIGIGTDQAKPGEHWLSSQNRNFKNRMGPQSIGNIASAATVAASSFAMQITDPQPLLDKLDLDELVRLLRYNPIKDSASLLKKFRLEDEGGVEEKASAEEPKIAYSEPYGTDVEKERQQPSDGNMETRLPPLNQAAVMGDVPITASDGASKDIIKGKVLRVGDFIDTDAIIPNDFLHLCETDEDWGSHCMQFQMPEFRTLARDQGHSVVVAGKGFGVGSSREVAVNALKGCGIRCVIAESFAFIFARNQPNVGLLGIRIPAEEKKRFYEMAQMGAEIEVDVAKSVVRCGGLEFAFELSDMEKRLASVGGIKKAFERFGKGLFDHLCRPEKSEVKKARKPGSGMRGGGKGHIADIESFSM